MDIMCAKCSEPWDSSGVPRSVTSEDGDMTATEGVRFRQGEGCPSCGFGTHCPLCNGSGKDSDGFRHCCRNGRVLAWMPRRTVRGFSNERYHVGYSPSVRSYDDAEVISKAESFQSADGWVDQFWIVCPACAGNGDHLYPCDRCNGSGKLETDEDAALRAAESEIDSSDEDPIEILVNRGLL